MKIQKNAHKTKEERMNVWEVSISILEILLFIVFTLLICYAFVIIKKS